MHKVYSTVLLHIHARTDSNEREILLQAFWFDQDTGGVCHSVSAKGLELSGVMTIDTGNGRLDLVQGMSFSRHCRSLYNSLFTSILHFHHSCIKCGHRNQIFFETRCIALNL